MADDDRVSIKLRDDDYEVAKREADKVPTAIINIFTAWRFLWESASEKQRAAALRRVGDVVSPATT